MTVMPRMKINVEIVRATQLNVWESKKDGGTVLQLTGHWSYHIIVQMPPLTLRSTGL